MRRPRPGAAAGAVFFAYDDVLCASAAGDPVALTPHDVVLPVGLKPLLERCAAEGAKLFAIAWRPQLDQDITSEEMVRACFERTKQLAGAEIEFACCPHPAGPPICWCRKPLPGLVLQFAFRHQLALDECLLIGRSPADRTLAERTGMRYLDASTESC